MKLKYYLRGAGIGVIVTTLILLIAGLAAKEPERPAVNAETEARSLTIAEALKSTEPEPSEGPETESTEKEASGSEPVEGGTEEPFEGQQENNVLPEEPIEEAQENNVLTEETVPAEGPEKASVKSFSVYHGDSPGQVSQRLQKEGIIEDSDAFYEYLVSAGLNDYLEVGDFSIPEGASFEEIGKILTTNEFAE